MYGAVEPFVDWIAENGPSLIVRTLLALGILFAGWIAAAASERLIDAAIEGSKRSPSPLFSQFVVNVTRKAVWLVAIVVALDNLGVDTAALIAGIGALLLLYNPFDVGDWVEVAGHEGTVEDLTLVYTLLHTGDNKVVTIPNSEVWGSPITNYDAADQRRIDLVAGIGYDDDVDRAMEVFRQLLDDHELVLDDPAPVVRPKSLGDSSVNIDVRGWVRTDDYWTARPQLVRELKVRCDEADINIPYPHRSIEFLDSPTPPRTSDTGQ
ncbi:MAG: mechanosensitive ion channel family protein [Bradymonadaceae bacterium]